MFVLSVLEDDVRVPPQELSRPTVEAIQSVLESTYIDKVIPELGLVVTLYDLVHVEGGFVYPSEGAAHFKVKFRVVVFRPFPGEVLVGKLQRSDRNGLYISIGFFEDVFVPDYALQEPSFWNEAEGVWVWKYNEQELYMDQEEDIRFKVVSVKYNDILAITKQPQEGVPANGPVVGTDDNPYRPMEVVADINADGLGLLAWWAEAEEE